MAGKRANREASAIQFFLELRQFVGVIQHRKFAMRIAGIISGAEFDGINLQPFKLFKDFIQRKLRQQRGETSDSHQRKSITKIFR